VRLKFLWAWVHTSLFLVTRCDLICSADVVVFEPIGLWWAGECSLARCSVTADMKVLGVQTLYWVPCVCWY
jgi:hypothetical protein